VNWVTQQPGRGRKTDYTGASPTLIATADALPADAAIGGKVVVCSQRSLGGGARRDAEASRTGVPELRFELLVLDFATPEEIEHAFSVASRQTADATSPLSDQWPSAMLSAKAKRSVHEQLIGCGVELGGLVNREREGLRHRPPVIIFDRRISLVIEQSRQRGLEAFAIFGERNVEPFAIGGCLLVGKRQDAKRLRQDG
jgi:hypothetical protein